MLKKTAISIGIIVIFFGLFQLFGEGMVDGIVRGINQLYISKPLVEEESAQSKVVGNITFKYKKSTKSLRAIDDALSSLNENKKFFSEVFGKDADVPVSIVLVNDPSKLEEVFGSTEDGYTPGYYVYEKKSIYIILPKDEKEINQYRQTIVHEYTHHLTANALDNEEMQKSGMPIWFIEGLAAYVERKDIGIDSQEIEKSEFVSFKELETQKQWEEHLRSPFNPYLQSRILVGSMINNNGVSVIQKLIEGCKEETFDTAFEETVGTTVPVYGSETLKTIKEFPKKIVAARGKLSFENNPEGALDAALLLNGLIPNVNEVMMEIASTYEEMGDYEKSLTYHEQIVKLFPTSPYYHHLASRLLFSDLEKAIEASKKSVELADSENVLFFQKYLDELNNLSTGVNNGSPLKAYDHFLRKDQYLSDKNKLDLINTLLDRYPNVSKGRKELVSLQQKLK